MEMLQDNVFAVSLMFCFVSIIVLFLRLFRVENELTTLNQSLVDLRDFIDINLRNLSDLANDVEKIKLNDFKRRNQRQFSFSNVSILKTFKNLETVEETFQPKKYIDLC